MEKLEKMFRELEEIAKERQIVETDLVDFVKELDKETAKSFDEKREGIVESATRMAKNAKKAFIAVSEQGCQLAGPVPNLLASLAMLCSKMKFEMDIDEEHIIHAVREGLKEEEKNENEKKLDELLNKLKELVDKM